MRELLELHRGRMTAAWDQTALLATLLVNTHIDTKKTKAARVEDFHPFAEKRRRLPSMTPAQLRSYKPVFKEWQAKSK